MILLTAFARLKRMAKVNSFMIMGFTMELGKITRDRARELFDTILVSFTLSNGKMTVILGPDFL